MEINEINSYLKNLRIETYKIENSILLEKDELTIDSYIIMLITAARSSGNMEDNQSYFIKKVIKGVSEKSYEDYLKKSYEIDNEFLDEFFKVINEKNLKYSFVLDCLISAKLGKDFEKSIDFISSIIEVFGLTMDEINGIVLFAQSVLENDSKKLYQVFSQYLKDIKSTDFNHHIQYYASGVIQENDELTYICNCDLKFEDMDSESEIGFKSKNIIFENVNIDFNEDYPELNFEASEDIVFKNCNISSSENYKKNLYVKNVNKLSIIDSKFKDFYYKLIYINGIVELNIQSSKFIDFNGNYNIFDFGNANIVNIKDSEFINCYSYHILCVSEYTDKYKSSIIENCKFINCKAKDEFNRSLFNYLEYKNFVNCENINSDRLY